jgi:hypothetical protein
MGNFSIIATGVLSQPTSSQLAAPTSVIVGRVSTACSPAVINIQWTSQSGGDEDDFDVQFRINGGTWTTSNTSPDTTSPNQDNSQTLNVNDTIEARVKANGSGSFTDSDWTEDTATYTVATCK